MATTRSRRKALGAAAPTFDAPPDQPASTTSRTRQVTMVEIPDSATGHGREGSAELEIPGSFAASPVNLGKGPEDPEPELNSDEIDERLAATHISIDMGASTDDESCPPKARTDNDGMSESCPNPASIHLTLSGC
ncbi:conserved oligomeric Golgi complex subunit 4 [Ceratobasidium sp. AG-Ba]|nr:conserved oligomeric Golgi complex subunit 4 [Ceratobasidium sp. AG-Ba]QRW06137.1 conserved oligomeric Golgi complex subunit 4 [Ceratobasidium sp. AG-Ba]